MARLTRVKSFRGTTKTADGTLTCGSCGAKITKGDSYLHWSNRIGSYSRKSVRCSRSECYPKPWEYQTSSPHIAAVMQAEYGANADLSNVTIDLPPVGQAFDGDSVVTQIEEAVHTAAEGVREAAEGYEESAQNMEDGFGHETSLSEELREKAEQLNSQADELESWSPTANTDPPIRDEEEDDDEQDQDDYERELDEWLEDLRSDGEQAIEEGCQIP